MNIIKTFKKSFEQVTGTRIFRRLPHGCDIFFDIRSTFPSYQPEVFFDVGANIGQSAIKYHNLFPSSYIYCFEPVTRTFEELQNNTKRFSNCQCFNIALSSSERKGKIFAKGISTGNYLLEDSDNSLKSQLFINATGECIDYQVPIEKIDIKTIDIFCKKRNIQNISYLKIDTEGNELQVIKGSNNLLRQSSIDFIEIESGLNPYNKKHIPLEVLKSSLEEYDYLLFGIYEQFQEVFIHKPYLRRSNCVFISPSMSKHRHKDTFTA